MTRRSDGERRVPWGDRYRWPLTFDDNWRDWAIAALVEWGLACYAVRVFWVGGSVLSRAGAVVAVVLGIILLFAIVVYLRRPVRRGDGAPVRRSRGHRPDADTRS